MYPHWGYWHRKDEKYTTWNYEGGKQCEMWLPVEVQGTINRYVQQADLEDDDPLVGRSKRTVQYWVDQAADQAAEETGDDDYRRCRPTTSAATGRTIYWSRRTSHHVS